MLSLAPNLFVFNSLRVNGRLFLVYILGFLLLCCSFREPPRSFKGRSFTLNQYQTIKSSIQNRALAGLLYAFISGDKKKIFPTMKKKFKALSLSHLFTPSGIHLASLYFFLLPIMRRLKNKLILLIPLLGAAYFLTPFHSIKRILLMKTVRVWLVKPKIFTIFILSFTWDFFLVTYHLSPMSFAYSFLFLGIIISFTDSPKLYLPLAPFGGQIITQFLSPFPLTTTGFFWNFLLTGLFAFLYPFYFILYWIPGFPLGEKVVEFFYFLVATSPELALSLGTFMPTLNLVLLSLYLSIEGDEL